MTLENGLYRTHSIYSLLGSPGFLGVLEGRLGLRLHHILMIAHVSVSGVQVNVRVSGVFVFVWLCRVQLACQTINSHVSVNAIHSIHVYFRRSNGPHYSGLDADAVHVDITVPYT
jgi:hypothetical protein